MGLSPRTRRNQSSAAQNLRGHRSISAHAEEPAAPRSPRRRLQVYLRARGGTGVRMSEKIYAIGLSPRTRRNR
ncbi:Hypothetical protein GbCGDNIH7_7112a [Granulibacter bethesdensis]|nr:Hypothetical protein GbCGDNIH7_7112a [Granulibacter bethesdensis]